MHTATVILSIWGGAGPLVGAGFSAWWANRVRIADRKWMTKQAEINRKIARKDVAEKTLEENRRGALSWRRSTFIDFFSCAHDFLWVPQGANGQEVREQSRQKFTKAFATLMLLDGDEIGKETQDVWNATHTSVGAFPHATPEQTQALMRARANFAQKAHTLITAEFRKFDATLANAAKDAQV